MSNTVHIGINYIALTGVEEVNKVGFVVGSILIPRQTHSDVVAIKLVWIFYSVWAQLTFAGSDHYRSLKYRILKLKKQMNPKANPF